MSITLYFVLGTKLRFLWHQSNFFFFIKFLDQSNEVDAIIPILQGNKLKVKEG